MVLSNACGLRSSSPTAWVGSVVSRVALSTSVVAVFAIDEMLVLNAAMSSVTRRNTPESGTSQKVAREGRDRDADRGQISSQPQHRVFKVVAEHEHQQLVAFVHEVEFRIQM
jgi:hypothetical protein